MCLAFPTPSPAPCTTSNLSCPRSGTSSWVCIPAQPRPRGEVADICLAFPTPSPAPCTTSYLSCPPCVPAHPPAILRLPLPPCPPHQCSVHYLLPLSPPPPYSHTSGCLTSAAAAARDVSTARHSPAPACATPCQIAPLPVLPLPVLIPKQLGLGFNKTSSNVCFQFCILTLRAPAPPVSQVAGRGKPVAAKPHLRHARVGQHGAQRVQQVREPCTHGEG
jgi:hypothetical protein